MKKIKEKIIIILIIIITGFAFLNVYRADSGFDTSYDSGGSSSFDSGGSSSFDSDGSGGSIYGFIIFVVIFAFIIANLDKIQKTVEKQDSTIDFSKYINCQEKDIEKYIQNISNIELKNIIKNIYSDYFYGKVNCNYNKLYSVCGPEFYKFVCDKIKMNYLYRTINIIKTKNIDEKDIINSDIKITDVYDNGEYIYLETYFKTQKSVDNFNLRHIVLTLELPIKYVNISEDIKICKIEEGDVVENKK